VKVNNLAKRVSVAGALIMLCCGSSAFAGVSIGSVRTESSIRDAEDDAQTTAVMGILKLTENGAGMCSGTLISPNVVLTAQHCVAPLTRGDHDNVDCTTSTFGETYLPNRLYVTNHHYFIDDGDYYTMAHSVVVPPGGDTLCDRDIALIVLSRPIPSKEAIPLTPRVDSIITTHERFSAVGYGGSTNDSGAGVRRRQDDIEIQCVGLGCKIDAVTGSEWIGDANLCSGDSGGPAIDEHGRVIGVASRGTEDCMTAAYTGIEPWGEWIKQSVYNAAVEAGVQPPPWSEGHPTHPMYNYPVGRSCSTDSFCLSGDCRDFICTRACNEYAPCPDNYSCDGTCYLESDGQATRGWGCQSTATTLDISLFIWSMFLFICFGIRKAVLNENR